MILMWVVQTAIDVVVNMVAMRNSFVAAIRAMSVVCCMAALAICFRTIATAIVAAIAITASDTAASFWLGAISRVGVVDFQFVFVYMISMWMVQVAVM